MGWLPRYKRGDIIETQMSLEDMDDYWLTDPRATTPDMTRDATIRIRIENISILHRSYDIIYLKHPLLLMSNTGTVKWHELDNRDYKYSLSSKLKHL